MSEDSSYVIDTCSLTQLNRIYPEDMFKPVWDAVEKLIINAQIFSIDEVYLELEAQDDLLLDWAKKQRERGFFKPLTENIQNNAKRILSTHSNLLDFKRRKSSADAFLIGFALIDGSTIVTEEKPSGGPEKSKIPDVCDDYSVRCINLLDMLREVEFHLR